VRPGSYVHTRGLRTTRWKVDLCGWGSRCPHSLQIAKLPVYCSAMQRHASDNLPLRACCPLHAVSCRWRLGLRTACTLSLSMSGGPTT
jgi:hypothetical protein